MQHLFKKIFLAMLLFVLLTACNHAGNTPPDEEINPLTSVQVITVADSSLTEYIEFTAVSAYLQKSFVKANINGYVASISVKTGQQVSSGQQLFSLITKEAKSIGNSVNKLIPDLEFSGISKIKAAQSGLIVQVNHQKGDYVQEGDAMTTMSNLKSLVFLMDLPYEYNQLIIKNNNLTVELPDGSKLKGIFAGIMPAVDSLAQTQKCIIKVNSANVIPEGLIAKVKLVKTNHPNAQILPKSAVLSNETEDEFWVMKMINDSTAVRVNVTKGIENNNHIEIVSPEFDKRDRIIVIGNYGIADTAKVKVLN